MFSTIIKVIRIAAFLGVLGAVGFLGYEYVQTRDSSAVVETVKSTAETGAGEVRKGLQRLDLDRKVSDLQDKARPVGRKISATVGPKISPSFQAVQEGERRMSWPALILVFVFGTVFVLLGKYSDSGRY